ncbi:MAG: M23 family metallopeptidase [bacterium]|nr:M23 family metallopeptidase [bacterium]
MKTIHMKFLMPGLIVLLIAGIAAGSGEKSGPEVTIEILPANDIIYKIPGDLNFENWNFGFLVKGLYSISRIDRLQIKHYSGNDQIHLIEYQGSALSEFLKKKGDGVLTFTNFHMMLPTKLSVDKMTLELFSKDAAPAQKTVKLSRYRQRNRYRLPFEGTWFVSSGHDFGVEHRRHLSRGHFAWDFVRINEKGHVSNGPELENNFAFGQPLLAPADGIVVDLHKGEPDNEPGAAKRSKKANYIEIDHGNEEISRAVHLKKDSIRVSIGDKVTSGQMIALIGNSGNSEIPHLHFGFQRNIIDGNGKKKQIPIPIRFNNYRVTWNQGLDLLMKEGRPRRGQFVRQD